MYVIARPITHSSNTDRLEALQPRQNTQKSDRRQGYGPPRECALHETPPPLILKIQRSSGLA